jgi:hypothetical protein
MLIWLLFRIILLKVEAFELCQACLTLVLQLFFFFLGRIYNFITLLAVFVICFFLVQTVLLLFIQPLIE